MLYIYNCFAGTHSSALAAAYHLNKLPKDREPTKEEILGIDIFNKLTPGDFGRIIYHGKDEDGNKVYTLGRGKSTAVIPVILRQDSRHRFNNFFSTALSLGGF